MTLAETVQQLHKLDSGMTIYAEKPWTPHSRSLVGKEAEDGSAPPEAEGLDYFLEVDLAQEAAAVGNVGSTVERVIYYAENDAFLREL